MPTLEEVEAAFHEWRTTKKKRSERIPEELLSMARTLVGEHEASQVAARLVITTERLQADKKVIATDEKFVELPAPENVAQQSSVTVRVRPGTKNEIAITVPAGSLNWQELIKGLSKL